MQYYIFYTVLLMLSVLFGNLSLTKAVIFTFCIRAKIKNNLLIKMRICDNIQISKRFDLSELLFLNDDWIIKPVKNTFKCIHVLYVLYKICTKDILCKIVITPPPRYVTGKRKHFINYYLFFKDKYFLYFRSRKNNNK